MYFKRLATAALLSSVLAQRPSDVSICDYYTTALLKQNTPANQYLLITLLVNAVVIGNYTQPNTGVALAGILAPAVYNGEQVNLLPYFNGCLKSTNVNGQPGVMNFLDGGGAAPLMKNMPADDTTSNQYFLLTHLYQFIGKLVGCSGYGMPGFPSYGGDPSMYNVHKYMGLDENEVGLFIQQVGLAALSYGVSNADATAAGSALMAAFGYRCSPPMAITDGADLQSICIAKTCPLDPNANCNAYPWYGVGPEPMTVASCGGYSMATSTGGYGYASSTGGYQKPTSSYYEKSSSTEWEKSSKYEKPTSSYYEKSSSTKYEKPSSTGWEKSSSTEWEKSSSKYEKPTSSYYEKSSSTEEYEKASSTSWAPNGSWRAFRG